jgi:biotin carboxyl carrier protein
VKFRLQVDGREYEIAATPDGVVTIGGESFDTKTGSATPDRRVIQVGEKNYEIRVVESTEDVGCYTLEVAGERVPLTVSDLVREATPAATTPGGAGAGVAAAGVSTGGEANGRPAGQGGATAGGAAPGGAAAAGQDGLFAPVPGKIVDVFVKPGDAVDEGTPLVVLEAMKMENELRSPKKGRVTAVLVTKGDTAERGQLLVGLD